MANLMPVLRLDGVPEFQQVLRDLGPRVLSEGVKAMRKAMTPIVRDYKRRIVIGWGYGGGQYRRSVGVLYGKAFKDRKRAVVKIGPRHGFASQTTIERNVNGKSKRGTTRVRNRRHDPRMVAHLVERGHRIANGQGGFVQGRPSMEPAVENGRMQAIPTLGVELGKSLEKIRAKQAARRAG